MGFFLCHFSFKGVWHKPISCFRLNKIIYLRHTLLYIIIIILNINMVDNNNDSDKTEK